MEQYNFANMGSDLLAAVKADPVGPLSWSDVARLVTQTARECKRVAEGAIVEYRGKCLKHREAQVLAINSGGRTRDCEPVYFEIGKVSGKWLREQAAYIKRHDPEATAIAIDGGLDLYDTLRDMMQGNDYEPSVETWEVEVPQALWDTLAPKFKWQVFNEMKQRQESAHEDKRDAERMALALNDKVYPEQHYVVCEIVE